MISKTEIEQIQNQVEALDVPAVVSKLLLDNYRLRSRVDQLLSAYDLRVLPDYPQYRDETIFINPDFGFLGVNESVWDYHIGGYHVIEKWLESRRGRVLDFDDLDHVDQIVISLSETLKIQTEIDEVIEDHGGFPIVGSQDADAKKDAAEGCHCANWTGRQANQHHEYCPKSKGKDEPTTP